MALGDGFHRKAKAKIEARIGEPVEVLGCGESLGRDADGGKGARLPINFLVALTPTARRSASR